jgi:hypothetical protein
MVDVVERCATERETEKELELGERIAYFTVSPCGAGRIDPRDIVIVPPEADGSAGFARARELLGEGRDVRLVATAATVEATWPEWVKGTRRLLLTELGAYRAETSIAATADLREAVRAWTAHVFEGVVPGLPAARVFYASSATRVFQPMFDARLVTRMLVACHPGARFHHVNTSWAGVDQVGNRARRPSRSFAPKLIASSGAALAGTVVDQIRHFKAARASVRALRTKRRSPASAAPSIWAGVIPDFIRASHHVVDSVLTPELADERAVGVLLFSSLRAGVRHDSKLRESVGDHLWPALDGVPLSRCVIEQCVGPETPTELARDLLTAVWQSCRVVSRMVRSPILRFGNSSAELTPHVWGMAKLATLDVARAISAQRATERVVRLHDLAGATVVMAASGPADCAAADLTLQRAGARTIELVHGTGGNEWQGAGESPAASARGVWSFADAAMNAGVDQELIVAGMPRRVFPRDRGEARATQVLLLTNYMHRDSLRAGRLPYEPFLREALGVVPLLRGRWPDRFSFMWRPHPADTEDAVERARTWMDPSIVVSRNRGYPEDIAWAHIVIASVSTTVVESLFADIPVFVHMLPEQSVAMYYVDPSRRFFRANDLPSKFDACVRALDVGDDAALAPERRSRTALFGTSGAPTSLPSYLRLEARR